MNPKNSKKSPIHENADANITCDFGDGDISRSRSFLSTTGLNHATNHPQTHMPQTSIDPLNPSGVGLVNFFGESQSRLYPHMRAKFGRGPTVVSKKGSLKFISRWLRLWHGGHVEKLSPSWTCERHAYIFKRVRNICRNQVLCITIWKNPLLLVSCLLDYCSLLFVRLVLLIDSRSSFM